MVVLRDQFSPDTLQVKNLAWFANPAEKRLSDGTSYPISDPHLHYAWWDIDVRLVDRVVNVDNQFGGQRLSLVRTQYLWNPALKDERGPLPVKNHYKCYLCGGNAVSVQATLIDQYGPFGPVSVLRPVYFCNPTEKIVLGGRVYPMVDPDLHYVCYEFLPTDPRRFGPRISDQFMNDFGVTVENGQYLCVPTLKVDPTPARPSTWGRLKLLYR
jgi:hypothetical protein